MTCLCLVPVEDSDLAVAPPPVRQHRPKLVGAQALASCVGGEGAGVGFRGGPFPPLLGKEIDICDSKHLWKRWHCCAIPAALTLLSSSTLPGWWAYPKCSWNCRLDAAVSCSCSYMELHKLVQDGKRRMLHCSPFICQGTEQHSAEQFDLKDGGLTTNASETAGLMESSLRPSRALVARTSRRNGGLCPCNMAMLLPATCTCNSAALCCKTKDSF